MREKRVVSFLVCFLVFAIVGYASFGYAGNNETMTVEANIFASASVPEVSIQVPDYIFFGNLTKGEKSDEMKVYVNNTGSKDVSITPNLVNSSEKIFSYLYFKRVLADPLTRIGSYSYNLSAPTSGNTFRAGYFYAVLDLTDYPEDIPEDMINHKAEVIFWAVAA